MRHDFLDRFSRLSSPVHRCPSGWKLLLAFALLVATVAVHFTETEFFVLEGVLLVAVTAISRIPPSFIAKRLLTLEPFVFAIAVLSFFQPEGFAVFLSVIVKSTLCLLVVILLSNTTPFPDILRVARRFRVPSVLVTVLALMYRYVFLLIDEAERMHRARMSRTFNANRLSIWKIIATVIGQLFVRSTERAERIYSAMLARGWK